MTRARRTTMAAAAIALLTTQAASTQPRTQAPKVMSPPAQDERVRVERLAALARVWAIGKHFHPFLAYREDIAWDAAFVSAIAAVRAAKTADDYAAAVQTFVATLDDPVTRVVTTAPDMPVADASAHAPSATASPRAGGLSSATAAPRPPSVSLSPDGVLVVSSGDYATSRDASPLTAAMTAALKDLPRARAVLFDLRSRTPRPPTVSGFTSSALLSSGLARHLSATAYVTPAERTRALMEFRVEQGRRITPADGAVRDRPIVAIVNAESDVPAELMALQVAGKARIVAEGPVGEDTFVTASSVPIGDGRVVRMRITELVFADGARRVQPDATLDTAGDATLAAARAMLTNTIASAATKPAPRASAAPIGAWPPQTADLGKDHPDADRRVLAAFMLWDSVEHFFPYKELMREDWDDVLKTFIPRLERAAEPLAYHLAIAEMLTRIHDSHGVIQSPVLAQHFGMAAPPIRVRSIDNQPVVTGFRNEAAARAAGLTIGDVILTIDGEAVADRLTRDAPFVASSTPQAHTRDLVDRRSPVATTGGMLFGADDSTVTLRVRHANGDVADVTLTRRADYAKVTAQRGGEIFRLLPGNIGYADLDRVTPPLVDELFARFKDTRALIFDMRGHPRTSQQSIASRLTDRANVPAARATTVIATPPGDPRRELAVLSTVQTSIQTISGAAASARPYPGKTVMLMDERSQSAAEHMGLLLKAANGTVFIGTHTAGANGNVRPFQLPGGITYYFSGIGVAHVDGRPLQRVGLIPDVEVKPTLNGMQAGKDEVLDAALEYLRRPTG